MFDSVWSLSSVTLAGRERPRLDNVSLQIRPGVTAVMGASGAGKSSLLSLLTGFEQPDDGQLQFAMPETPPPATLPLFWSPQDHGLWSHLTVEQHVGYVLPERAKSGRSAMQWLELFELNELGASLPDLLSQGERSRLAVVRALASEASVLVLDEPLVHVDPLLAHRCWRVVDEHLRTHGSTVVFSAHDPDTVMKYARNVVCLDHGKVTFSDSVDALWHRPPTKELAWLLGPCNWFGEGEDGRGLLRELSGLPLGASPCVRPGELGIVPRQSSGLVVQEVQQGAQLVTVRCGIDGSAKAHTIFSREISPAVKRGVSVALEVVASRNRQESSEEAELA